MKPNDDFVCWMLGPMEFRRVAMQITTRFRSTNTSHPIYCVSNVHRFCFWWSWSTLFCLVDRGIRSKAHIVLLPKLLRFDDDFASCSELKTTKKRHAPCRMVHVYGMNDVAPFAFSLLLISYSNRMPPSDKCAMRSPFVNIFVTVKCVAVFFLY